MDKTMELKIEYIPIDSLKPYSKNARKHTDSDVGTIIASISKFGFSDPIGIWSNENLIVEGHGRFLAAKKIGMKEVPCIRLDHLNDEQRRAYALAHNKTAEMSEWDFDFLTPELNDIVEIDMTEFGFFDISEDNQHHEWFGERERFDQSREEGNEEYNEFLEKFETKKTTDDCYTPDNIYEVIAEYVEENYGKRRSSFVRPFYPGGDYQKFKYKPGDVVVDNPPFSILAEIVDFYCEKGQPFFLFSPGLSNIGYCSRPTVCAICTYAPITYENGAQVPTSFLTNLGPQEIVAITAPDLYKAIEEKNDENERAMHKHLPKYDYPVHVATAAKLGYLSKYGQAMQIRRAESVMIRALDAQKDADKGIFGSALLLSEKAAAEKAAAERWPLSEREKKIIQSLGGR